MLSRRSDFKRVRESSYKLNTARKSYQDGEIGMELWSKDVFRSLIGEKINAYEVEGPILCELTVLEVVDAFNDTEEMTGFTVIFHCDEGVESQGCVRIDHHSRDPIVVFVSPKTKNQIEAVFN